MSRNRGTQFRPTTSTRIGSRKPAHDDTPAASSNITAHSYNPETGQLTITYRGDRRYAYDGVPPELADGLEKADSKGRYVHVHIIDKFPATRIRLDD
jgi:hypothetical protein